MTRRILATLALSVALLVPACVKAPQLQPAPACQEDQPCWDWRTMGNGCGRDNLDEPVTCVGGGRP